MIVKESRVKGESEVATLARYIFMSKDNKGRRDVFSCANGILLPTQVTNINIYAESLAADFGTWIREKRANKTMPATLARHLVISWDEDDEIDEIKALQITAEAISDMQLDDHLYVTVVHSDTAHMHTHTIFSEVNRMGKIYHSYYQFQRWGETMESLERKYGFVPVDRGFKRMKPLTIVERRFYDKTNTLPDRIKLASTIDRIVNCTDTFTRFVSECGSNGINLLPRVSKSGELLGLSYRYRDKVYRGGTIGRAYTWPSIQKNIEFDPVFDRQALLVLLQKDSIKYTVTSKPKSSPISVDNQADEVPSY